VAAPAATPPPLPLTAVTATPHGPSTLTPGLAPFRCGPVSGGGGARCPAASPIGHAGRLSPLRSPSIAGRPDFCITPGASTSGGVATVDDPWHPPIRSSSAAGRPNLRATLAASTTSIVFTVDEFMEPAVADSLLPHHDDVSSHCHRLGCRFWHLQPHHFQCR
jgi:hypothetical protein